MLGQATLDPSKGGNRYKATKAGGTGLVMPAFDDLGSGTPFNLAGIKLLGPLLSSGVFQLATATIHLVDGTFLGELRDLALSDQALLKEQDEVGPAGPVTGPEGGASDGDGGGED